MRFRNAVLAGVFLAAAVTSAPLLAGTANASSPPICTTNASSNGCMNRDGGGTGNGTPIILWHNDGDAGNSFKYGWLSSYCGFGQVSANCPFSNTAVDSRYLGDRIYELFSTNVSGKCIAAPDYANASLQGCGAIGYVFVRSASGYLVSVGATNHFGQIGWVTASSYGNQILVDFANALDTWTSP